MVVSSLTPRIVDAMRVQRALSFAIDWRMQSRMTPHSSGSFSASNAGHLAGLLELGALVHEQRRVAAVVDDQRRAGAVGPLERLARCTTSTPRASRPSTRTPACPSGPATVPPVSGRPTTTAAAA